MGGTFHRYLVPSGRLIFLYVQFVLKALAAWLLTNRLYEAQALHIALLSIYRAAASLTHKSRDMAHRDMAHILPAFGSRLAQLRTEINVRLLGSTRQVRVKHLISLVRLEEMYGT